MKQLNIFRILFLLLFLFSNYIFAQPNWPVTTTGDNHTIIIEGTITLDIEDGGTLAVGDSLGVFFDDNGTLKCAGKAQWTGNNISITAYGDDSSSPEKDGFDGGETFQWRIWRSATNTELNATATYQALNIVITHMGSFAIDGISAVASLTAAGEGGSGPDWPVLATGDNHTVIVESTLVSDLGDGATLSVGDYIGVYFDDNGTTRYAGKAKWTGTNISVTVYGDDNTTNDVKEGLIGGETFQWRIWQAATETEFNATATYQPTNVVISHMETFAIDGISALATLTVEGNGGGAPEWEVVPTSENHTIVIPASIQSSVGGSPIADGDYIGVFYRDLNGEPQCAGFGIWQSQVLVFPAYGNDIGPFGKNGLDNGDRFIWKVWKSSESQEYSVMATYLPVEGVYTHQQLYQNDGVSGIATIFSNVEQQTILLNEGWNLVSSYINPVDPNLGSVFSAISSEIAIVKNISGDTYIPDISVNQIGNWDYKKGYAVRAKANTVLTVYGTSIDPSSPIELPVGWSILPYLRTTSQSIATALNSILPDIAEVKDASGNSFIPIFGVDNIGVLVPGQAYKIRMVRGTTLMYTARMAPSQHTWTKRTLTPIHFNLDTYTTNNNATIVIPKEVGKDIFNIGDEVAVTDLEGALVGSAVFEGNHLAFTIWGSSQYDSFEKGLMDQEPFKLQYWDKQRRVLKQLNIAFENGTEAFYQEDEMFVARQIWTGGENNVKLVENPVKHNILFEITLNQDEKLGIDIFDLAGKRVHQFSQDSYTKGSHKLSWQHNLSKGIYAYHTVIGETSYKGKIVISE